VEVLRGRGRRSVARSQPQPHGLRHDRAGATSASNDTLSAQHALDEASGNGAVPLLIKDLSGRTVAEAPNAWIRKLPMVEFGREVGTREWVLDCDELIMFVGATKPWSKPGR
jgi:hypothetical protein